MSLPIAHIGYIYSIQRFVVLISIFADEVIIPLQDSIQLKDKLNNLMSMRYVKRLAVHRCIKSVNSFILLNYILNMWTSLWSSGRHRFSWSTTAHNTGILLHDDSHYMFFYWRHRQQILTSRHIFNI